VLINVDSDTENKPPVSERANKKLRRSVSKTGSDDMKELKDMLASAEKSRQESSHEMVETLKESTRVYEKTSERYLEVLMTLARN
jgi:hypothetical protein